MLDSLRNSWFTKILITSLFGFAVLGLVFMDVNGVFRGGVSGGSVAKVGGQEISISEFDRFFQAELRASPNQQLMQIPEYRSSMAKDLLHRQVRTRVLSYAALDSGLVISDRIAAVKLRKFLKPLTDNGIFEDVALSTVLQRRGISEDMLVASLKDELAVEFLMTSLSAPIEPPKMLLDDLNQFEQEKRSAHYIEVTGDDFKIEKPDDAALAAFYQERSKMWMTEEFRGLSLSVLTPEKLFEIDDKLTMIDEKGLKELYEERREEFSEPDKRKVIQAVFTSEDDAKSVAKAMQSNKSLTFAKAMKDKNITAQRQDEEEFTRKSIFPAELTEPVFGFEKDKGTVGPVKSPLGWHVASVLSTERGAVTKFADLKAQLKQEWVLEQASDTLFEMSVTMEDELASGASVKDVAEMLNLSYESFEPLNSRGLYQDGKTVKEHAYIAAALRKLYEIKTDSGFLSEVVELDNGVFIAVGLGEVVEPKQIPFEEVKDKVAEMWTHTEKANALKKRIEEIITAIRNGKATLTEQAKKFGYDVKYIPPKKRALKLVNKSSDYPHDAAIGMFDIEKPGGVKMIYTQKGHAIVELDKVELGERNTVRKKDDPTAGISDAFVRRGLQDDIVMQYYLAKGNEYGVKINEYSFDKTYGLKAQRDALQGN